MTVPNGSRYLLAAMVLIALVAAAPGILHADPFNLSANWNYSENGGESVEEQWKLNQSYSLGFNKSLTALTNLTSSVRYTKSTGVLDSDSTVISPSLSLTTRNDLFHLTSAQLKINVIRTIIHRQLHAFGRSPATHYWTTCPG